MANGTITLYKVETNGDGGQDDFSATFVDKGLAQKYADYLGLEVSEQVLERSR